MESTSDKIVKVSNGLRDLLLEKNKRYGDSALNPTKIFSKVDSSNGLFVRLDDKLTRIKNSTELNRNDVSDIMGYLILVCIDKGWDDFKDLID